VAKNEDEFDVRGVDEERSFVNEELRMEQEDREVRKSAEVSATAKFSMTKW
jgi:hypothetical protein